MRLRMRNKGACPIGLDLGTHSVRLVQLQRVDQGWRVIAATSGTVPESAQSASAEAGVRNKVLSPLIRQLLNSAPFVGRRIVSGLPATMIQYKNMRLPMMPPDELKAALEWEASDRLRS